MIILLGTYINPNMVPQVKAETTWYHAEDGSSSYGDYTKKVEEQKTNVEINQETISNISKNLILLIASLSILVGIKLLFFKNKEKEFHALANTKKSNDLTEEEIQTIDKNLTREKLIEQIFSLYKESEIAKMKFNDNKLKELLTADLYQDYNTYLKELKKQHQKIVATDIKKKDLRIISIQKKEQIEEIEAYLYVSQYDYIIDKNKKIIRGTDESKYEIEYKIIVENNHNQFKIKKKDCLGKWITK